MDQGGTKRFYVTRPDMLAVSQIADHIQSDSRARRNREYVVIFVPRRLASCEYILEREGVHGLIRYMELKLHLIPLDEHILSLERNKSLFTLHIDGDMSMLHSVAESILLLERHHGTIPVVHGKGHLASMVWSLYSRLKDAHQVGTLHHEGGSQITELVLFDRSCDYVTPLCSQLTYEGILDDTFGIKSGFVEVGKEREGPAQRPGPRVQDYSLDAFLLRPLGALQHIERVKVGLFRVETLADDPGAQEFRPEASRAATETRFAGDPPESERADHREEEGGRVRTAAVL